MNYGRRTTKTTTHRDTPLSATPEPRFQNLAEITVTPSKEQIKSYTSKANSEADRLNNESNVIGMVNYSTTDATTRKIMYPPTKRHTNDIKSHPNDLLDYGNPMDKPNLSTIRTSKANLEKAKKINAREKKNYNYKVKTYTDKGWSKDEFFDFGN